MTYRPVTSTYSNSEGTQMLPDDGVQLPKHVGAFIWNEEEYKIQCIWLVILYMFNNAHYEN
jgi:hypothetical protein